MTKRFEAHEVALELVRSVRQLVARLKRIDPGLSDQVRRAASSVVLSIGEGNQRVGRDRLHLFRIAAGSAAEVRSGVMLAAAWGYLTEDEADASLALVDRELAMLYRLSNLHLRDGSRRSQPSESASHSTSQSSSQSKSDSDSASDSKPEPES